uniref:Fibronectin type-III domain-containing protein n=1 Tax=Panagrolaimus sp. JU765 TaxID=591449 RepID=A0AC34QS31_9BILA
MIFHQRKKLKFQRIFKFLLFFGLFLLNFQKSTGQAFIVANSTSSEITKLFHDSPDSFKIQKDPNDSSRLLNVFLPSNFRHFKQFIAKVADISPDVEFPMKDVNRTFLASPTDSSIINIHGLNAGHQYSITIYGRIEDVNRTFLASPTDSSIINIHGLNAGHQYSITIYGRIEGDSQLIKEESIIMDPLPLDFHGSHSKIHTTYHNVTMKTLKPEKALQDTFRVEYVQLDPPKRYPILDVHDIQEQRDVELYLGNLNPGKDYDVMVTSLRNGLPSTPWKGIITTKPLKPGQLIVQEINSTCINLSWILPAESGADKFKIAYGILKGETDMIKLEVPYIKQQIDLCQGIVPGYTFIFAVIAEKSNQISDPATISYTIKPLPAENIKIEPDFGKGKYKIEIELPTKTNSKIEKCQITVFSDQLEKNEEIVKVEEDGINTVKCLTYMPLTPGRRYEISVATL